MDGDERRMLGYAKLAELSRDRGQPSAAHRFLVLAGVAACRAGYLDVAERCHAAVVAGNPRHLLARYATLPDALRDNDFTPFERTLERECPWERSEHVLSELDVDLDDLADDDPHAATLALV